MKRQNNKNKKVSKNKAKSFFSTRVTSPSIPVLRSQPEPISTTWTYNIHCHLSPNSEVPVNSSSRPLPIKTKPPLLPVPPTETPPLVETSQPIHSQTAPPAAATQYRTFTLTEKPNPQNPLSETNHHINRRSPHDQDPNAGASHTNRSTVAQAEPTSSRKPRTSPVDCPVSPFMGLPCALTSVVFRE